MDVVAVHGSGQAISFPRGYDDWAELDFANAEVCSEAPAGSMSVDGLRIQGFWLESFEPLKGVGPSKSAKRGHLTSF